ncbi:hypothetical protein [Alicyclobacillus acidocaldarius]|uniref:Uncharacterized protein n=1 Tax=Alicyclobacillus acidocaldarius subsp. acidocaldarius (strain ATCC 27009 / DSM 446 / BCRC 14685 / JCM 5260 / KCTC 1825 / NBRC 15652 / NCIMB 11725 / NRRL B-14509 / 104-IA) TaxID=521098 RepID=C8WYD7_ALIAD|nr:hypothetical protein [Alicyclobacillus acidocaldarius]ACV60031.1 hypothetical protein Aaci_3028 [Alicyclobacillus acidocaldarius subsp. acidocaldarius DSM 446]
MHTYKGNKHKRNIRPISPLQIDTVDQEDSNMEAVKITTEITTVEQAETNEEVVEITISKSENLEIKIKGSSKMSFWGHDLKLEAILTLLETIDFKDFETIEDQKELADKLEQIREMIDDIMF